MAGKLVNEGENFVATVFFGAQDLYLGLYTNETEPAETDDLAAITEVTGDGYARIILDKDNWTITADVAAYAQQTFEASGSWGDVTGYFIATSSDGSGVLLFVEQFSDGPYAVAANGAVKVTPQVTVA